MYRISSHKHMRNDISNQTEVISQNYSMQIKLNEDNCKSWSNIEMCSHKHKSVWKF